MEIEELLASAKEQTFDRFVWKLNDLVRKNYRYRNLSESNKKVVLDFIKKHLSDIHRGIGISALVARQEMYHLYEDRLKLNLTADDLKDIKEIIGLFEK